MQKRFALLVALTISALPLAAQAQRKSPLADAPAIRKRLELRSSRFEIGVGAGSSIDQDFYHSVIGNVKLGFHFTDWLSLAAVGGFALANMDTGFKSNIVDSLNPNPDGTRAPTKAGAVGSMNQVKEMAALQIEATPFTGKYSLFGKLFAHYDFYFFGGAGFLNYDATTAGGRTCSGAAGPLDGSPCAVTGLKIGPQFGVGIHSYINQFLALNVELRDIFAQNNAAGRDVNGDQRVDNGDLGYTHTVFATLNVMLFLPSTADISN